MLIYTDIKLYIFPCRDRNIYFSSIYIYISIYLYIYHLFVYLSTYLSPSSP